jgi:hypothetical protein
MRGLARSIGDKDRRPLRANGVDAAETRRERTRRGEGQHAEEKDGDPHLRSVIYALECSLCKQDRGLSLG